MSSSAVDLLLLCAQHELEALQRREAHARAGADATRREAAAEGAERRMEALGARVGAAAAERRCAERPRILTEALDAVKVLCKELWVDAFGKGVDNLKTNHRGTFVLLDASHRPLRALSGDAPLEEAAGGQEVGGAPVLVATPASVGSEGAARATAAGARAHLAFGRGFARGAMQALGLGCTVSAEAPAPPAASFTLRVTASRAQARAVSHQYQ